MVFHYSNNHKLSLSEKLRSQVIKLPFYAHEELKCVWLKESYSFLSDIRRLQSNWKSNIIPIGKVRTTYNQAVSGSDENEDGKIPLLCEKEIHCLRLEGSDKTGAK